MTYPINPALTQAEALHPTLWDGLAWLYLPGHSSAADIITGDVLAQNQPTTIDTTTYAEGVAEVYNLAYRLGGAARPLEGTSGHTTVHYVRPLGVPSNDGGVFGTAPSTTWSNVCQNIIRGSSGDNTTRHLFRRLGVEAFVDLPGTTPLASQVVFAGRRASDGLVFVARDAGARLWSATGITGALTSTEATIIGRYYADDARRVPMAFFWGGIWNRELTLDEQATIAADPYAVFRKAAVAPPQGTITLGTITVTHNSASVPWSYSLADHDGVEYRSRIAAGTWSAWTNVGLVTPIPLSSLTASTSYEIEVRAYNADEAGTAAASTFATTAEPAINTITVTEPLTNNTGTLLANQSGVRVAVLQAADMVSVHEDTGLTTNASGVLAAISDVAIVSGTSYHVAIKLADGSVGITGPITAS